MGDTAAAAPSGDGIGGVMRSNAAERARQRSLGGGNNPSAAGALNERQQGSPQIGGPRFSRGGSGGRNRLSGLDIAGGFASAIGALSTGGFSRVATGLGRAIGVGSFFSSRGPRRHSVIGGKRSSRSPSKNISAPAGSHTARGSSPSSGFLSNRNSSNPKQKLLLGQ